MLNITDLMQLASEKNVAFEIHRYDTFNPDYIEMEVIFAGFHERIMVWTHNIAFQDDKARLEKDVAEQVIMAINHLKAAAEREREVRPDLTFRDNERLRKQFDEHKAAWDEAAKFREEEKKYYYRESIKKHKREFHMCPEPMPEDCSYCPEYLKCMCVKGD